MRRGEGGRENFSVGSQSAIVSSQHQSLSHQNVTSNEIGGLLMPARRNDALAESNESIDNFGGFDEDFEAAWNDNRIFEGGISTAEKTTAASSTSMRMMSSSTSSSTQSEQRQTTETSSSSSMTQRQTQMHQQQQQQDTLLRQQSSVADAAAETKEAVEGGGGGDDPPPHRPSSDQFGDDDFDIEVVVSADFDESFCSTGSGVGVTRVVGEKPHLLIGDTALLGLPRVERIFNFRINETQDAFEAAGEDTRPLPPLKRGHPKRLLFGRIQEENAILKIMVEQVCSVLNRRV